MENKTAEENSLEDVLRWMDEDIDKAFERLLPSDEYGENEDAALIWQVVKDSERLLKHASLQCAEMKRELDDLQLRQKRIDAANEVYRDEIEIRQKECAEMKKENERLYRERNECHDLREKQWDEMKKRIEELEAALRGIEPFASEVVSRQTNESVFGYNSEMLTLSSLKNIIKALNHDTINKP